MRRTDRSRKRRRARRRRRRRILLTVMILLLVLLCGGVGLIVWQNTRDTEPQVLVMEFEQQHYDQSRFRGKLYATDLCVTAGDVLPEEEEGPVSETDTYVPEDPDDMEISVIPSYVDNSEFTSAGLFDLNSAEVDYAYNVHKKLYPASVTKIMTALVAIENADLDAVVTVPAEADSGNFAYDEVTIELQAGDQLTLRDLLYGLLLCSGNDAAVAIADYVGGSQSGFVQMMNAEAARLMATDTHFVNANGLQNDDHYTTVYDLYLIFNECIKHEEFVEIISTSSYQTTITGSDGTKRSCDWEVSNGYGAGLAEAPENVTVIGGKTGTTKLAGNCLILLDEDEAGNPFISVIMGADTRADLYLNMNALMNLIA